MMSVAGCLGLILLYPSASLRRQLHGYLLGDSPYRIRLLKWEEIAGADRANGEPIAAILDATERPDDVEEVVGQFAAIIGPARTLVYAEKTNFDLEGLARSLGARYELGPISPETWDAWLACLGGMDERVVRFRPLPDRPGRWLGGFERTSP